RTSSLDTISLHDALPISSAHPGWKLSRQQLSNHKGCSPTTMTVREQPFVVQLMSHSCAGIETLLRRDDAIELRFNDLGQFLQWTDRKSTRLNSTSRFDLV